MATDIKEKFDGFRCNITANAREYDLTYTYKGTATASEFPETVQWRCKGIVDAFARCVGIGNIRQLGPDRFETTLHYSTDPEATGKRKSKQDQPKNPLARPVIRRWGGGYVERNMDADLDGNQYQASNREPFSDGLPIRVPYLIKTYVRNEASFNETAALNTLWHMDSTHKILCVRFDGSEEMTENDIDFVQVTYEFWKIKPSSSLTWDKIMTDAGSYYIDPDDTSDDPKHLVPKTKEGQGILISGSLKLDGNGGLAAKTAAWKTITFRVHPVVDFSSLALPNL